MDPMPFRLPVDQTALIMRIDGRWKLLLSTDDSSSGWYGSFDGPDDALAALKVELSN